MDADLIDKRLAGLVLESHRDLRFEGNPTEVAYQYARALTAMKNALEHVGLEGIDYAQLAQSGSDTKPRCDVDPRYAVYVRRIAELEQIANKAFGSVDGDHLFVWSAMRLDYNVEVDPETGLKSHVPMTCRQAASHFRKVTGRPISHDTAHRWAKSLDKQLDRTLRRYGWHTS